MSPTPPNPLLGRLLRSLAAIVTIALLSSCEQSELFILLNPDGSGRVTTKETIVTSEIEGLKDKQVLEQIALTTLAEFVHLSKGIDAWEKVAYNITADGNIEVEATGLFPDLSKLVLASTSENPTLLNQLKFDQGGKDRPASIQLSSPILTQPQQSKPEKENPTKFEIAAELEKARNVWGDQEAIIRNSFENKSAKVTFHFSGGIVTSSNFKKDAKNQVSLTVTSRNMLDALEKLIADDAIANELLATGAKIIDNHGAPPIAPNIFNQLAFGEKKPIRVDYTPKSVMFDYRGAVDQAKANPSELLTEVVRLAAEAK